MNCYTPDSTNSLVFHIQQLKIQKPANYIRAAVTLHELNANKRS